MNARMKDGEVVLAQPPPEWQPSKMSDGKKVIWKLRKALYGLRTSPKRWQEHFGEILTEMGFVTHPHDACVYIMVCCHADDLLVVGRRSHVIGLFEELKKKVDVTYAEVTGNTTYLGRRLEVRRDEVIFGVDPKYVQNIMDEMGLKDLKGVTELKWEKDKGEQDQELEAMGQAEYRSLVGQLMWIDRTDSRKAIGKLATKLGHATALDRRSAVHVLRYLKGVPRVP